MNENMNLIPKIEEIVCKVFNITLEDLRGNRKFRSHTDARSVLFHILHVKYYISFYRLSRYYDKHHSIIIRSVNKCESLKGLDKDFYTKYRMNYLCTIENDQ